MLAAGTPERPAREQGRLSKVFARLLMKRATVTANDQLAEGLRLITLEGAALQGVAWQPGQKVQIAMGSAFVTRTYTPIEWNPVAGRLCFLGDTHGEGPGSHWVRTVAPGEACDIFGPRSSLDLGRLPGHVVIMGDETSIGLACAATRQDAGRPVTCCFEIDNSDTVRQAVTGLGLQNATLVARRQDAAHLAEMEEVLLEAAAQGASVVLTGKAGTIQRLRQSLKQGSFPASRIVSKAYWAPGKSGLD
jgi:NADPH-dependent ferric siderophore reductase